MKYYPVYLDVKEKNCLIVGGGAVGYRKAATLVKCQAKVRVVSETFEKGLKELKGIELVEKPYEEKDLDGMFLVFGATNNAALNQKIEKDARQRNILCNIADAPDASDFILPSIVNRGDLMVTVSTSGKSPAFAKKLREDLESQFGPEYEDFLNLMGSLRKKLLSEKHAPSEHRKIFNLLLKNDLFNLVKMKNEQKINRLLKEITHRDYTYRSLTSGEHI